MGPVSDRAARIQKSGIRVVFDLAQHLSGVIDLGIGEPDFVAPRFVREAAKKAIDSGFGKYTTNAGLIELRQGIAKKLKRQNGIDADPNSEIIVTSGATQGIFVLIQCLLNPGDKVLLPTPLFPAYKEATALAGGEAIEVPTIEESGFTLDLRELKRNLTPRSKLLVINSPCNPTGSVFERGEIEKICEFAKRHHLYVLSDEIYEKYVYDDNIHFSPASLAEYRDRIITINGFGKTYGMTGWRLGYAIANPEIISSMTKYNMYNAVCPTSFVQVAAIAALNHSLDFFKPFQNRYQKKRDLMCKYLDEMGWAYQKPKGSFYAFPKLPKKYRDSFSFSKKLLESQRVATIPGDTFGKRSEGHIRLSFAPGISKLRAGLDRIKVFDSGQWAPSF